MPEKQLEGFLRNAEPRKARTLLSRMGRHANDGDARAAWVAACLSAEGKEDESIAEFKRVKHLENVNNYALYLVAKAYCQTGDFARAKELCSFEIGRGDCCWECYDVRAVCYEVEKRYAEASADYEQAATKKPRYANGLYCKAAQSMLKANQPSKALAFVNKAPAIQKSESDVALLLTKGQCLERLNRNEEALTFLNRAIATPPSKKGIDGSFLRTTALRERANCYDKLGRKAEAAADRSTLEKHASGLTNDLLGK